jgi:hypothetical protein
MSNPIETNVKDTTTRITAAEEQPASNRFTPGAQERIAILRTMGEELSDPAETRPLTPADIRLARGTTLAALEKAALLAEAAPEIGGAVAPVADLRDASAFELAYGSVRDEALALARRVDMAILRRKLKAAKAARGLYRVAREYVTMDAGDSVRTHVTEMKRTLVRRRRKPAPEPVPAAKP